MRTLGTTFAAALLIGSSAVALGAGGTSARAEPPGTLDASAVGTSTRSPPSRDAIVNGGLQPDDTTGSLSAGSPQTSRGEAPVGSPASAGAVNPSSRPPVVALPLVQPGKTAIPTKLDKTDDPEDAVVPPATPEPSGDPLDALAPDPLDAGTDTAKPPADKPDKAMPAAAKPASAPLSSGAATAPGDGMPTDTAAPAQSEPLPPLEAAVKAALDKRELEPLKAGHVGEGRKERAAIAFFYAARGFAPLWSADGKPVAAVPSVIARLRKAGDDALTLASVPAGVEAGGSPATVAASDLALTEAVVAYARQATGSRVDPRTIAPLIGHLPQLADPAEVLDRVVAAGDKGGDVLAALNPTDPRYVALREDLARMRSAEAPARAISSKGGASSSDAIPSGPMLRVGMHDPRVDAVRKRLGLEDAPDDDLDLDPDLYDTALAEAVREFQRDNGLKATGTLNRRTLVALNGGLDAGEPAPRRSPKLEGTIIANMEMWRWMPRDLGADRIEVNVPDYLVTVFHDGKPVDQHRVVVGKQDTPTPLFSNAMKYLIVNPYWNVPQSIIKKEMLPKGGGSLSYLQGRGYDVGWHNGMATVKQLPGPKNALGQIKFLFPNNYSVYLHDTPSKALFAASKRAFSHGCVRVDKPFAFAESVLNDGPTAAGGRRWSEERLQDMIGDKEHYVNLPTPLPIHIEYFTASVEDNGKLKLREDIYGYAHSVASALGQDSEPAAPVVVVAERKPRVVAERARRRAYDPEETAMAMPAPAPAPAQPRSFWGAIFDPR